jgi:2-octaprenyl-6-methoxyphenol hydroxylase
MTPQSFDIVIAGGGLVGATLALALSQSVPYLSIAIVEAVSPNSNNQPSFDRRTLAIAQGSRALLEDYGVWSRVKEHAEPIHKIHVSDRGHIGKSYLKAEQFNLSALGFVVEARHLGKQLIDSLEPRSPELNKEHSPELNKEHSLEPSKKNVMWFCPAKIAKINEHQDHLNLTLDNDQILQAKLLLVADGGQSQTRQLLKIDNHVSDYHQAAIIANVEVKNGHDNQAFERFTKSGPMALLPLTNNRYSLVWCVEPDIVDSMLAWHDEQFLAELQSAFGYRAGELIKVGNRFSYPLALNVANDIVSHRVALVGNSSHTIHPIAGQGFNLGMRDIEALRQLITQCTRDGQDIGSYAALRQYQQMRQQDLDRVINMTDSLVRLFSNDNKMLALARTMGLLTMQMFDNLKQPLANQAMGFNKK